MERRERRERTTLAVGPVVEPLDKGPASRSPRPPAPGGIQHEKDKFVKFLAGVNSLFRLPTPLSSNNLISLSTME